MKPNAFLAAIAATTVSVTAALADSESPIPSSADAFTVYKEMDLWTVYTDASTKTCLGRTRR